MKLSDFDFELPENLIAQQPLENRSDSKLLVPQTKAQFIDDYFKNISKFLKPNDLLILNDTKVIPARLFAKKITGGKLEIMIERVTSNDNIVAMIKASKSLKPDDLIVFEGGVEWQVIAKNDSMYQLKCLSTIDILDFLEKHGHIPLPPYIKREDNKNDKTRYQTVFAKNLGAVAAPTAGLHFDKELLKSLKSTNINYSFITLHVGAGTFQPVRVDDIENHKMHFERYQIPAETIKQIEQTKKNNGRIIAVGTTVMRALETCYKNDDLILQTDTNIFIKPSFEFNIADCLITNFHLPKSSLLMLVSAFIGLDEMHQTYQHAIEQKYRFFSYGDAMFLEKKC
jgi:S-adenosylmethionine:tRNA ribosyltransferase-isomerase